MGVFVGLTEHGSEYHNNYHPDWGDYSWSLEDDIFMIIVTLRNID